MNSKTKAQPLAFISGGRAKEEKNAFRHDIGMTNDEGDIGRRSNSSRIKD